ncbi:MAG: cupin domain-containing protein [Rhodospirillales bacterium]|nr:MAG: cupin domain-containing protein [Rhodospirillales bacterium]
MDPEAVIRLLGLTPHPAEGGWFIETWRGSETLPPSALDSRYGGPRSTGTAIYYFLTTDSVSALHRLRSDEVFHFYLGDPVEMLQLLPGGRSRTLVLGTGLPAGQRPQAVVPANAWQGARLIPGGKMALLGCTVAPGFDYADYEHATDKAALLAGWPGEAERINALFRPPGTQGDACPES